MGAANEHRVVWTTAAPLWSAARGAEPTGPALLTFRSDAFMDDLIAVLRDKPTELSRHLAKPESFRERPVGAPDEWDAALAGLKLYQPVHGQFSLVAASLVCRAPGLPDRTVKRPAEVVGFVLRKWVDGAESAWTTGPRKAWVSVAGTKDVVVPGEEVFPLFPLTYTERARRVLYFGVIPTSGRETFESAPNETPPVPDAATRFEEFRQRVIDPWNALREAGDPGQAGLQSMDLLLDLAVLLEVHRILPSGAPAAGETTTLRAVLHNTTFPDGTRLRGALTLVRDQWDRVTGENPAAPTKTFNVLALPQALATDLTNALKGALASAPPPKAEPLPKGFPALVTLDPADGSRFVVRCVYRRPSCRPAPADRPVFVDVVGAPSVPFTVAPYFDPDAPTRPVRIALPADTSVRGLRKFARSVGFLTSAGLRKQICSVSQFKDALEGKTKGGCDEPDLGVVWKFSLPIITLCAFVMLIAMVTVLNIAFWWLPFFRTAEPVRK